MTGSRSLSNGNSETDPHGEYLFDTGGGEREKRKRSSAKVRRGKVEAPDNRSSIAPAEPTPSHSELLERQLASWALQKKQRGQIPSAAERTALKRCEDAKEEKLRWAYYRTIPQKHWREMSGRQTMVLAERVDRQGIRFSGKVADLPTVVKAAHDFPAANKYKLAPSTTRCSRGPPRRARRVARLACD